MAIDSSHRPSLTSDFPAKKKQTSQNKARKNLTYKTKEIKFCNQNKRIIVQNENGSCPLIAICNVLLLTNDKNVYRNRFQVSHDDLLNLVGDKLFNRDDKKEYTENQRQKISDAIRFLPDFANGINVDVKFRRIGDFEHIFDFLDIPLYHGWIVDPEDSETASAIGCESYNDLMTGLVNLDTHIVKARSGQSSVDFTATITPSQPCSKKIRSFADTTPTSAEHSKLRKGDIEEQRVLLRALPISERETRGLDTSRDSSSGESVSGYSDEYQMSEDGSLVDSVDTDSSCTSTPGSGNICQKTKCDDQVSSKESGDETASVVGNKIDLGEEVCSTTSGTKINGALDHDHLSSTELGDEMVCDVDTENSSKTTGDFKVFKSDSGNWDQQSAFSNTAVCASSSDSDEEWESDSEISESDLDDNDEQLQVTDPNGFMMVYPSRSEMLKRLPAGVPEFLKHSVMGLITKESAKICLGEERFNLLLATTPTDNLYIHDSRCRLYIFWKTGQLLAKYLLDEVARKRLENAAGFIRDQCGHFLCWAFALCDLISICRVLYGWDEEFKPLSPQYLCQNVNPTLYARGIGSESKHSCYGWVASHALFYVQKHGIVADIPDENYRFDCRERCDSEGIKYRIRSIFRYPTLQQALIRLKTHPVLATLICFEGWDSKDRIYRGPYNGGKYLNKHGVVMIDCTEIDGETVVSCKSSNGRDVGTDGCIIVSVEVMLMEAGATRHSSRPNRRMCVNEPTYLLYDFFSVDMEMGPNPKLKENPQQIEENSQFEIVDGRDAA